MDNSSILKVVKRIESFEYFSIWAHDGKTTNQLVSFPPEIVDFIPDAEKYFQFLCQKCDKKIVFGSIFGGSISTGEEACTYKTLNWTHNFSREEIDFFCNLFLFKMKQVATNKYVAYFDIDLSSNAHVNFFYKRCLVCDAEYFLFYVEVGRLKNWEHIGDIYVHGIWQVELSPEFREKHFKML